ncbi:FtsH protease modulator YccA [Litorivicinus lipolyticus]|uniref:FtsH protease modulator YccA n=1 Tax=Litorivicinus lipolyticus TaxID=418701 RepID=A0A5Q2Q7H2_9GAMM|nr:Bax inhibitor-1/YccA family protein [Litorivicinus lipolyticus]QGG79918.1 FtsH protease modulator YccA [Litorivicinus lipolyticus]
MSEERVIAATTTATSERGIEVSKVLRQTYLLLGMTLAFSAAMTAVAVSVGAQPINWIVSLVVMIGLLFALQAKRNSVMALPLVFAFTGWMGWSLGPMVAMVLGSAGGSGILFNATAGTAIIFFALSAYAVTTGRDFSFLRGFLMTGLIVCLLAMVAAFFMNMPALHLAISGALILLASGFILFDTSNIVNGGETNYVMATVSLYINIYMLFSNLLAIMGVMGSDD